MMVRTAVLAVLATLSVAGASVAAPRVELTDVEDEVMCPICGTALNLSGAPQADRERALIRRLIAQGLTKEQIKDALVAEYGERVLAVPPKSGFDLTAWLLPVAAIALAAIALLTGVRRWRRRESPEPEAKPLTAGDRERLETDLARYDL